VPKSFLDFITDANRGKPVPKFSDEQVAAMMHGQWQGPPGILGVWLGSWDSGTLYLAGDGVEHSGNSYVAIAENEASEPPSANWDLVAAKGEIGAGPQGEQGIQGQTGAQGLIGPDGPAGPQGTTGTTGSQGPIGNTGGVGAQGPIGVTGDIGPQGATGSPGASGTIDASTVSTLTGLLKGNGSLVSAATAGVDYVAGAHKTTHEDGGADEISVAGLTGLLGTAQTPAAHVHATSDITGLDTALSNKQPLDADLTAIAALTATSDNFMVAAASAWASRTPAQAKTSLALVKADVGLSNVDNTSDANKPVSTAQQTAIDGKQTLDADLTTLAGLTATTDNFIISASSAWASRTPAQAKTSLALVKGDVGLGSVDNTTDAGKPVSTAQQTALNLKADLASPTFTGTPSLPTGTTATTQSAADSTTKLATTAFATTADNLKANLAGPTFTGTPTLPTGTIAVTQSAGDSTTAIATTAFATVADNLKANLASPTFTGTPIVPTAAAGTNTTQVATTAYAMSAVPNSSYRTLLTGASSHTAAKVAGTYALGFGDILAVSGTGTLFPLAAINIVGADYPTVNSLAPKLRIRAQLYTNDVAPTGNYTFGLYPITRPGTSGGALVCIFTLGTVVTGSNGATFTAPAADGLLSAVGADFALPADGHYVLGVITTATVATSAHVHLVAHLQLHNA